MTVKNIHRITDQIPESDLKKLEQSAYNYARHTQLYFKIAYVDDEKIIVQAKQEKTSSGEYFTKESIKDRATNVFRDIFPDHEIAIRPSPYQHPPVDVVNPDWIRRQMSRKKVSSKQIREFTGIDKGTISNWISGNRNMSQAARAMFYLFLKD